MRNTDHSQMTTTPTSTSLTHHSYGKPDDVLVLESVELPDLGNNDALIRILAAPINPADFGRIGGSYGELAPLPATAGLEGVAEVISVGNEVTSLRTGQRVFVPSNVGSWQTHAVIPVAELFPAPEKLPLETAAMGWVNPATAWLLIHDFTKLKAGDWIIQNAATSAVGKLVIQFARHMGLKTINLVRSLDSEAALKKLGADIVLLDNRDAPKSITAKAKLALNSVGGSSALIQCKVLENGSPLITFGAMDREAAPFPTRYLIFNDIQLKGFWITNWYRNATREQVLELHQQIFTFMETANVTIDVAATYPLEGYKAALDHAQQAGKSGKVLFQPRMDANKR